MYQKQWSTFIFIVCSQKDATEEEKSQSCEGGQGSSCKKWVSTPFTKRRIKGNDPTLASSLSLFYLYIVKTVNREYGDNLVTSVAWKRNETTNLQENMDKAE